MYIPGSRRAGVLDVFVTRRPVQAKLLLGVSVNLASGPDLGREVPAAEEDREQGRAERRTTEERLRKRETTVVAEGNIAVCNIHTC